MKKIFKRGLAAIISVALVFTLLPDVHGGVGTVHAAENGLSTMVYATPEQLLDGSIFALHPDYGGVPHMVEFGYRYGPQGWYIAGKDPSTGGLVLIQGMYFEQQKFLDRTGLVARGFSNGGSGVYYDDPPEWIAANHYGCSDVRQYLKGLETDLGRFTASEQNLMQTTTIYTWDEYNNRAYVTNDKLYLANTASNGGKDDWYITVGSNTSEDLYGGLKIDVSYSGPYSGTDPNHNVSTSKFWLRGVYYRALNPYRPYEERAIVTVDRSYERYTGNTSGADVGDDGYSVVSVFSLDLSTVLFASAAPKATPYLSDKISSMSWMNEFILRYDGSGKLDATAVYDDSDITVTAPAGSGLVVQYNDGSDKCYVKYFPEAVTNETILASDIAEGLHFKNCKIWIEKTEDRITYAVQAEESGHVHIPSGELQSDAKHHWYECSVCGGKGDVEPHSFDEWIIDTETTENGEGTQHRVCSVCGYTEYHTHEFSLSRSNDTGHWRECECGERTSMDVHSFEWISLQGHACEGSYYYKKCTECGYTYYPKPVPHHTPLASWDKDKTGHWHQCMYCYKKLDMEAHDYGDWSILIEPTETTTGAKVRTCQTCRYREYITIPKLGHEHDFSSGWKTSEILHWRECECGDKMDTAAHTFGDWIIDRMASENEAGEKHRVCSVCGYTETHTHDVAWGVNGSNGHWSQCNSCGDKLSDEQPHVYGDWIIEQEATTSQGALKHRYCIVCGFRQRVSTPPLGVSHSHSVQGWGVNATSHWQECSLCGQKFDMDVHSFGAWIIDVEATESSAGLRHRTCSVCAYTENAVIPKGNASHIHDFSQDWGINETSHWHACDCGEKADMASHSFGDWIIDTETTENVGGTQHRTCSECGYTETHTHIFGNLWSSDGITHWHGCNCGEKKDEAVHSYGDWVIEQEATESRWGYKYRPCSICGYRYYIYTPPLSTSHTHSFSWYGDETSHWERCTCGEIVSMSVHSFGGWVIDKEATESEDGRKHRICGLCGYIEYVAIPKGETSHTHSFSLDWGTNETGHWHVCDCGEKTDVALHSFGDWIIDIETTENEAGARHRTCSVCGYTETHTHEFTSGWKWKHDDTDHWLQCRYCDEKIYTAAHSYSDWIIDKEATESETGKKSRRCPICQGAEYVTIPKLGEIHTHSFSSWWSSNETSHWHDCGCGERSDEAIHSFGDWLIDKVATETEAGEKHRVCSVCNYTERVIIPKVEEGHTHGFTSDWSSNETSHWHVCDCGEKADTAGHSFGEWIIDREATESEAGEKHRTCSECGYTESGIVPKVEGHIHSYSSDWSINETNHWHVCDCGEKTDTAAHSFSEWITDKEATESEAGEKHRICSECGYTETVIIPAEGESHEHNFSPDWSINETSHWHVCDCGEKSDTALHSFGEWVTDKEASESEAGEKHRICGECGYTETVTIPKAEGHIHSFSADWSTNDTNHWHQCSACGEKGDMAGHSFDEWITDKEATEIENGAMHRDCKICGYTENRTIPKLGAHVHNFPSDWSTNVTSHWRQCSTCGEKADMAVHSFGNWITDKEASETEDGARHRTCSICGYTEERTIPKVGANHTHSFDEWITDKQATESETGEQHRVCSLCGYTENGIIPKVVIVHTHSFGGWITDKEASESEAGTQHRTCSACGYTEYGTIPKLEVVHTHSFLPEWSKDKTGHWHECDCGEKADMAAHSFGGWITDKEATESENGLRHRICSICGYTESRSIPKTGNDDTGTDTIIGGDGSGSADNPDSANAGSEAIPETGGEDTVIDGDGSGSTDNTDDMPVEETSEEPIIEDHIHIKIYVTMVMIGGLSYLMSMFFGRHKTAESKKKSGVSA